jgi:hypothetical protein
MACQLRALALACAVPVAATAGGHPPFSLDAILGSDMVLPADNAQLWGIGAAPTSKISVTVAPTSGGGSPKTFSGAAGPGGSWAANVTMPAGLTLYKITVATGVGSAEATETVMNDVLFGALVICAGQSNMAVTLDDFGNYTNQPEMNVTKIYQEAALFAKQIRIFTIAVSGTPPVKSAAVKSSGGTAYDWGVPSEDTLGGGGASPASGGVAPRRAYFSAECWGTGVELAKANPTQAIGLICAARGGAAIQSFMSKAAVAKCPKATIVNPPHFGGVSAWWTGMIEPLRLIRPTGFVWVSHSFISQKPTTPVNVGLPTWRDSVASASAPNGID